MRALNLPVNNYTYTLVNYIEPVYHLRLKIIDNDGHYKYGPVVIIKSSERLKKAINVWPNPVIDNVVIRITSDIAYKGSITIVDMLGQIIFRQDTQLVKGENIIGLNKSIMAKGVYTVRAVIDNKTVSTKLFVN